MVMERLRNFAMRKRGAKASSSRLSNSVSRRSFIEEDDSDKIPHSNPSSIQRSDQANQGISGTTIDAFVVDVSTQTNNTPSQTTDMSTQTGNIPPQAKNMSTQTDKIPFKTSNMSTQTEPEDHPQDGQITPTKKKAAKKGKKKATAPKRRLKLDSQLLAMIDTLVADTDAVLSSGLVVSQRLNDTAREILEAKSVMSKIDEETTQISSQMEMMKLRFDSAHVQFNNARDLHRSILDSQHVEGREEEVLAEMLHQVQVIEQLIKEDGVENWSLDKVNNTLSSLDQMHKQNTSLYKFRVVDECISTIMEHFKGIKIHPVYEHLWLVGVDTEELLHKIRNSDHSFAESHKTVLHKAKNKPDSAPAPMIIKMKYCKEKLSKPQLQLLQRTCRASDITRILSDQRDLMRKCVSDMINPGHDSPPETEDVTQQKNTDVVPERLEIFCDSFYHGLGDEIEKMIEGKRGKGQGVMTTAQGAEQSLRALRVALLASQSQKKNIGAASLALDQAGRSHGYGLTDMDKVALAHLATCEICKKVRVDFLSKLKKLF